MDLGRGSRPKCEKQLGLKWNRSETSPIFAISRSADPSCGDGLLASLALRLALCWPWARVLPGFAGQS